MVVRDEAPLEWRWQSPHPQNHASRFAQRPKRSVNMTIRFAELTCREDAAFIDRRRRRELTSGFGLPAQLPIGDTEGNQHAAGKRHINQIRIGCLCSVRGLIGSVTPLTDQRLRKIELIPVSVPWQ